MDATKLMSRVAELTDAEVLAVLAAARAAGSDRYLVMALAAEAFHRGLVA